MSNILSHNRPIIDFHLVRKDYWDFHLSRDYNGYQPSDLDWGQGCLVADIDTTKEECRGDINLYSSSDYIWENAINDGLELKHIGFTGVDNGYIKYEKDRITNAEFLNLFFNSILSIPEGDKRFILTRVEGNNQDTNYSQEWCVEDDEEVLKLNGGFYQGFFKDCDSDYQVLPSDVGNGWTWEVTFKKSDLESSGSTLNDKHPENKGIILYIGTRAENKWWEYYSTDESDPFSSVICNGGYVKDDYVKEGYLQTQNLNTQYLSPLDRDAKILSDYFADGYLKDTSYDDAFNACGDYMKDGYFADGYEEDVDCDKYVDDNYIEKDKEIDPEMSITMEDGLSLYQTNVKKITTDNKFLFYDETPEGFKAGIGPQADEVTLVTVNKPTLQNYFLLFNRTPNGYTTDNIDELIEAENNKYDVLSDLYKNAFAIQIRDDGSIGYKYMVKNCDYDETDEESLPYLIESEFTGEGIITNDVWYTAHIKFVPEGMNITYPRNNCSTSTANKMRIYIYVNGKLVLRSKSLAMFNLKALNDGCEKQEGVPYNLSIGGGTQGLCDVIYLDYLQTPKYVLPLEREFGGSFVGYIKRFRFYNCPLTFNQIQNFST